MRAAPTPAFGEPPSVPPPREVFKCGSRPGAGAVGEVDCGWPPSRSPEVSADRARTSRQRSTDGLRRSFPHANVVPRGYGRRVGDVEVVEVAGHEVRITNPGKVFFPERGNTKLDLARYYLAVAE